MTLMSVITRFTAWARAPFVSGLSRVRVWLGGIWLSFADRMVTQFKMPVWGVGLLIGIMIATIPVFPLVSILLLALLGHELAHLISFKIVGIETEGLYAVPFLGGLGWRLPVNTEVAGPLEGIFAFVSGLLFNTALLTAGAVMVLSDGSYAEYGYLLVFINGLLLLGNLFTPGITDGSGIYTIFRSQLDRPWMVTVLEVLIASLVLIQFYSRDSRQETMLTALGVLFVVTHVITIWSQGSLLIALDKPGWLGAITAYVVFWLLVIIGFVGLAVIPWQDTLLAQFGF